MSSLSGISRGAFRFWAAGSDSWMLSVCWRHSASYCLPFSVKLPSIVLFCFLSASITTKAVSMFSISLAACPHVWLKLMVENTLLNCRLAWWMSENLDRNPVFKFNLCFFSNVWHNWLVCLVWLNWCFLLKTLTASTFLPNLYHHPKPIVQHLWTVLQY